MVDAILVRADAGEDGSADEVSVAGQHALGEKCGGRSLQVSHLLQFADAVLVAKPRNSPQIHRGAGRGGLLWGLDPRFKRFELGLRV